MATSHTNRLYESDSGVDPLPEELTYREWEPPEHLRPTVRCVWALWGGGGEATPVAQPIVPDGCPEVVLNLADPFVRTLADGRRQVQPDALFVGQTTGPTFVRPSGACRVVGIRLQPWGAAAWVRTPVAGLVDALVPLEDVLDGRMAELRERLAVLAPDLWAEAVFAHLTGLGLGEGGPSAALASAVVDEIRARGGRLTVRGLARRFHVSDRTVERVLRDQVGLPPVVMARIVRLQDALGRLLAYPGTSLGRVAMASGYYDQAHFSREFRRLVGCAPSVFLGGDRSLTDHFVQAPPDTS